MSGDPLTAQTIEVDGPFSDQLSGLAEPAEVLDRWPGGVLP